MLSSLWRRLKSILSDMDREFESYGPALHAAMWFAILIGPVTLLAFAPVIMFPEWFR